MEPQTLAALRDGGSTAGDGRDRHRTSNALVVTGIALVILAIAAGVSPLLGVVGIYGVITYITAQRAGEVRIRVALGAQTGDITRLFVRHGLLPADDSTRAPRSVPSYLT